MINTSSNLGEYRKKVNQLEEDINNVSESLESATTSLSSRLTSIEGTVPISRGGTGATNFNNAIKNLNSVGLFSRSDMGSSLNIDDPPCNGLFEIRTSELMPSGTIPCNGYYPLLNLKSRDKIVHLQIAGTASTGYYIRGKQAANVTLANTNWQKLVTVISTYSSGTSWYRVWSDGWIEQGGRFTYTLTNGGHTTLNFNKAFTTTNYQIVGSGCRSDSSPWQGFATFRDFNTTYCNVAFWDDTTSNPAVINWYACGY